ncbi:MAG: AMP-dependent synthetase/ligase [Chitinophagaceae bacterium]
MTPTPSRLFDLMDYQLARYPKEDMFASKQEGKWKKYPVGEVKEMIDQLSWGFLQLGLSRKDGVPQNQDKMVIISQNRPEWMFVDLACQQIGVVLVPIYPTIHEKELEFILKESGAKFIFAGSQELLEKVRRVQKDIPSLQEIFSFDSLPGVRHYSSLIQPFQFSDFERMKEIKSQIQPGHLATIIYTSGTTGIPKGVMLSHQNILSNVLTTMAYLPVDHRGKALSFLPLNHIFERMVTYVYIASGVSIYYAESLESIGENLREVQPSIFTTVPRLLEKVFDQIMIKGNGLKGIKRKLFFWALNLGGKYELNKNQGIWYDWQLQLANMLVFSKWREALGGQVKSIVTGAAACQYRLLQLFTAAGIPILEGYGLTETSPVISVNRIPPSDRRFGTVGPIIENVEVKIAEDGEILTRGPNLMMGYFNHPELTEQATADGWFHTGDIGLFMEGRFLKITDRKKELFKTSGGKYVAPQPIENKFKESPFIGQIMVIGADQKFPGALIVPAFHNLKDWAKTHRIFFHDIEELLHEPEVHELYRNTVEKYNQYFSHVEQIKKFELLPQEWTVEGGELTPTLKLKRKIIMDKNREVVERIYS